MAYSKELWEKARGYYEAGLSLAKIKDKTGIDRSAISKKAKSQQWQQGKNADYIEAKEIIAIKKSTENQQSLICADEVADERTKHIMLFNNATLRNQSLINKVQDQIEEDIKDQPTMAAGYINHINTASQVTARNRESILGKNPETQVNIQNNTQVTLTLDDFYED